MSNQLGRVLLIVNPTAQNGRAKEASAVASKKLRAVLGEAAVDVRETEAPRHAEQIAAEATGYDRDCPGRRWPYP